MTSERHDMTALEQFNECEGDKEPDPIERLRFFCSFAMHGQDWLDVEPFFDAIATPPKAPAERDSEGPSLLPVDQG